MLDTDWFYQSPEFQDFFKDAKRSLVLRADAPRFTVLAASDLYLALTRKHREEVIGHGLFEVYPGNHSDPAEKDSVYSSFMRVIESGRPDELPLFKYEIDIENSSSRETHYWTNENEPKFGPDGKVAYIINTTTNITDKIKQENALKESEDRFRIMADGTHVMIAVGDDTGAAVYFNKAWEEATGRNVSDLLDYGWTDLVHPDDRQPVLNAFNSALDKRDRWTWEFRMLGDDGYRWFLAHGLPRFDNGGNFVGYISSSVDITIQKEHQIQLAKLNKELYLSNEKLLSINKELQKTQDELLRSNKELAKSESDLAKSNSRLEEREHLLELSIQSSGMGTWIADLQQGKLVLSERSRIIQGISNDANLTLQELINVIEPLDRKSFTDAVNHAILHENTFVIEYRINTPDEHNQKWVRTSGIVYSHDGRHKNVLGTIFDITEQKLNEQRKNDFITMVSHELKTPLTSVNGYVQICLSKAQKLGDTSTSSLLMKTSNQIGKMNTLINGFLNVSRLESAQIYIERSKFDMAHLLLEVEDESVASISTHNVFFAPTEQTLVIADRDKISQVINNLITNAVKYSPHESNIYVSCDTKGDWAIISVKDEGMGISEQNLPKLFERYYRVEDTLQAVSGFGIGLYLCYEIVSRHDGSIWAESQLGKGSTFYFTLPIAR
jgi:two-component system sensor histidine kinase VicK